MPGCHSKPATWAAGWAGGFGRSRRSRTVQEFATFMSRRGTALPNTLPVLFILHVTLQLYSAFVLIYMPAAGVGLTSPISLAFHAFAFLALASYVQALCTDPGTLPKGQHWRTWGQPPPEVTQKKRGTEEGRWCKWSRAYKPDRAHYCKVVRRVVLRMDHHCPWLLNTVGWGNHKFFVLFLAYASALCGSLCVGGLTILLKVTLPALEAYLMMGTVGITGILGAVLLPFTAFHLWLLLRNETTIEFCSHRLHNSVGGEWDLGALKNVCSVMGPNPLLWCLPIGGPMGDGVSFPRPQEKGRWLQCEDVEAGEKERSGRDDMFTWNDVGEFCEDLAEGFDYLFTLITPCFRPPEAGQQEEPLAPSPVG